MIQTFKIVNQIDDIPIETFFKIADHSHATRVLDIAPSRHVQGLGFVIVKENDPSEWKTTRMQNALSLSEIY